jgi:hypothetical protein
MASALIIVFLRSSVASAAVYECIWNGGDGSWETQANWVGCNGVYPQNSIADTYSVVVTAGTVTMGLDVTVDELTLAGGALLLGDGDLTVVGHTAWTSGRVAGTGVWNVEGSLSIVAGDDTVLARTLRIAQAAQVTLQGSPWLWMEAGSRIENAGEFILLEGTHFHAAGTPGLLPAFSNTGVLRKAVPGVTIMGATFDNAGRVAFTAGGLETFGGTSSGTFELPAGPLFLAINPHYFAPTSSIEVQTLSTTWAGTGTIDGSLIVHDAIRVYDAGSIEVNGWFSGTNAVEIVDGTLSLSTVGGQATIGDLALPGGVFTGSDSVTVTGSLQWTGGSMAGTGSTNLACDALVAAVQAMYLDGRTLSILPGHTMTLTTPVFLVGATLNNAGVIELESGFGAVGGGSVVNNTGLIHAPMMGSGEPVIRPMLNNEGMIQLDHAQHLLLDGGSTTTGTIVAADVDSISYGNGVTLGNGTHVFTSTSQLKVPLLRVTGSATIAGSLTTSHLLRVDGGELAVTGNYLGIPPGTDLVLDSGTVDFSTSTGNVHFTSCDMNGGVLTGTDTVHCRLDLEWLGGALDGTGALQTATVNGIRDVSLNGRTLITGAPLRCSFGDLQLTGGPSLALEVQANQWQGGGDGGTAILDGTLQVALHPDLRDVVASTEVFELIVGASDVTGAFSNAPSGTRIQTMDGTASFRVDYGPGSPHGSQRVVISEFAEEAALVDAAPPSGPDAGPAADGGGGGCCNTAARAGSTSDVIVIVIFGGLLRRRTLHKERR